MAFTTRYLRKISLFVWALACMPVWAEGLSTSKAEAALVNGQLSISTRFHIKLSNTLYQALIQGIPLSFRLDFELTRPRMTSWYLSLKEWFDPHTRLAFKLSYQPLTDRYRVTLGSLSSYYPTLDNALAAIGAIQGWKVLDSEALSGVPADEIAGQVRLELDISGLPKPYQLNALGSSEWMLSSDWVSLTMKGGS